MLSTKPAFAPVRTGALPFVLMVMILAVSGFVAGDEDKSLAEAWDKLPTAERFFTKGRNAFNDGSHASAIEAFEKCLRELPRHAYARYYLANIFYIQQDYPEALTHMEEALRDLPFMEELHDYGAGRKERKLASYQQMLEAEWENTTSCRMSREIESLAGELSDKKSKLELEAEQRTIARLRQKAHFLYFTGNILFQLQRWPEAARKYQETIALDPRHVFAYNNAAAVSYLSGDPAGALSFMEQAEQQGLEDNLNLNLKHLIYEALGRPTEGILQEDLSMDAPDDPGVERLALAYQSEETQGAPLYENCYIVFSRASREAVLIDPGMDDPRIADFVAGNHLKVRAILNTHGHPDHTGANARFAERFGASVLVHDKDAGSLADPPEGRLEDGQTLQYGGFAVKVLHTPGHTEGSVCFLIGDFLFSGDTLFKDGIGSISTENPKKAKTDQARLVRTIEQKLLVLGDGIRVCPGHGKTSTIAGEKAHNPFLAK